jgi:hypothetical protein
VGSRLFQGRGIPPARWLDSRGFNSTVYAFSRTGVQPSRAACDALLRRLNIAGIVLVDGGTDTLSMTVHQCPHE